MKVKLQDIPEEGLKLNFPIACAWLNETMANPRDEYLRFAEDAVSEVELTREAGELRIRGHARATYQNVCARCLAPVERTLDPDFRVTRSLGSPPAFPPGSSRETPADEVIAEDYLQGDELDLDEVVLEQIAILLPFKILCRESCKGLCPRCGSNWNEAPCGCPVERDDAPFAALRGLKIG